MFCPTRQTKDYTCGPACARSVLNFLVGTHISEAQMARACRTTSRDGTTPENLVQGFWVYGIPAKLTTLTRPGIIRLLEQSRPVPILWGDWSTGGHWVVVIGVDKKQKSLLMADPSAPTGLRCHKWATLARYWQATINGKTYRRCGVLV